MNGNAGESGTQRRSLALVWLRVLRNLVSFLVAVAIMAAVAGVLVVYLAFATKNLPLLRTLVVQVGRLVDGQQTDQLDLDVRLQPGAQEMVASARLQVRAKQKSRQRLYFLLSDGLRIAQVRQEADDGNSVRLQWYQLGPVVVINLPKPLGPDEKALITVEYRGNPMASSFGGSLGVLSRDEVLIRADAFWYPSDLQSFFNAHVRVTLPAVLTLLHNGQELRQEPHGRSVSVEWTTPRPVPGLALVAGHYRESTAADDDGRYRVELSDGVDLEAPRVLSALRESDEELRSHYGSAGFPQTTLFVSRALDRAFNDGTGLIGMPPRYFRGGDYGFGAIAHEVAHNWWGDTVAERWLQPGTGGEWIVEGFAEFSSLLAERKRFGQAALLRRLEACAYQPTRPRVLSAMSVLDNNFDPLARPTIYQKGAYVTFMLSQFVGEEAFFTASRAFIDRFRYRQATDADLESVFAELSQKDLGAFFASWVRSDASADLSLDPHDGGAVVRNHGTAPTPPTIDLWRFPPAGEPERQTVALEAAVPLGDTGRLVLDPMAAVADMYRGNNVFPRRPNPRKVAVSARGEIMVVYGEPYPWSPATVTHLSATGEMLHSWEFDRGILPDPSWAADGTRILGIETEENGRANLVALNIADGSRRTLGHDPNASGAPQGMVVTRGDCLLHVKDGKPAVLARHPHHDLGAPLTSFDGSQVAYASSTGRETDLRVVGLDGANDRLLFTWNRSDVVWQWAPDGSHLFAVLPGDWDWQLWELSVSGGTPRALVREAAAIGDLAVAADGRRIALLAAPTLDYAHEQRQVFVLDLQTANVQRFRLDGATAHSVAWRSPDELLVVVSDPDTPALPRYRELRRLALGDGSLLPFP